jgi:hypothetical protein
VCRNNAGWCSQEKKGSSSGVTFSRERETNTDLGAAEKEILPNIYIHKKTQRTTKKESHDPSKLYE